MSIYKEKLFHFFKTQMGGSRYYIGADLKEVHHPLGITDAMFDQSQAHVLTCIKKQKPKGPVFREFLKRVRELRSEIVTPPEMLKEMQAAS